MIHYIIAAGIGAFLGSQSKKSKKSYAEGGEIIYTHKLIATTVGGNQLSDYVAKNKGEADKKKKELLKEKGIKSVEIVPSILRKPTYAKGGGLKDIPYGGNIPLRKGDKIKVDHPDIKNLFLYIIGSRGDGYDYMSSDNVEKRWGNGGWFDQMIRNPKNELVRKPISGTKKFAKGGSLKNRFKGYDTMYAYAVDSNWTPNQLAEELKFMTNLQNKGDRELYDYLNNLSYMFPDKPISEFEKGGFTAKKRKYYSDKQMKDLLIKRGADKKDYKSIFGRSNYNFEQDWEQVAVEEGFDVDVRNYKWFKKNRNLAKGGKTYNTFDEIKEDYDRYDAHDFFTDYVMDRIDSDERRKIREDWNDMYKGGTSYNYEKMGWQDYLLKRVNEKNKK